MTKIKYIVESLRPYNATTAVLAFFIGYFFDGRHFLSLNFYLGILAIIFVHCYATLENDIHDIEIDKINSPEKPIASAKISMEKAKLLSEAFFVATLAVAGFGFPTVAFFVLVMLFISWLYNSPPVRFSRHSIASIITMAAMYSVVPMTFGRILTGQFNKYFIVLIIFWFILRISISILKDFKDAKGDRIFSKYTFYLRFGKSHTTWISIAFALLSFTYIGLNVVRSSIWLGVILAILGLRSLWLRVKIINLDEKHSAITFRKIFFEQNYFDIVFLLWLLL